MSYLSLAEKNVGETVYNLGNGRGKARLNRDAEAKGIKEWRISVISSGEVGIVDKLAENKEKAKAGQLVRFIDVDAEVPDGYGIYNDLHGFKDGATLSNTLKENCSQYYGIVGESYIKALVHIDNLEEVIEKYYKIARQDFYIRFKLDNAHGQVKRVADTFAVYLLGGSVAQKFGIIPSYINIETALFNVFERWLKDRGSKTESFEKKDVIDDVLSFLIRHEARFVKLRSVEGWHTEDDKTINNCLGGIEDKSSYRIYYVAPDSFRDEICAGKSVRLCRKILREKGSLLTYEDGSDRRYTINGERTKMTTLAFTKS